MPGFVLTWAPAPTGRAPHTRVAPCRSQLSRAKGIGGLLRPVVAPPMWGALRVAIVGAWAFQPLILPGRQNFTRKGSPVALCRFRCTRARGQGQQLGVSRAIPRRGSREEPLQPARPMKGPPGRERQLRRHGSRPPRSGGGARSRRHAGGLRPRTQSASPRGGLAVVRSGAFSSARASSRCFFTWGLGSATGARPVLARTSLDHRAGSAARSLSSP